MSTPQEIRLTAPAQTAMEDETVPRQKALEINLSRRRFGTFAEIGAGQEVVRWFFHAGEASATISKSLSAYDTAVSDDIYGATPHYVSRQRLEAMLDHEYTLVLARSDHKRGDATAFFVFADTVATRHGTGGHGWIGVRFQTEPRSQPSEIVAHVQLLDPSSIAQQAILGRVGVNLIHSAFFQCGDPARIIGSLKDGLHPGRMEVDLIRFTGPAFQGVDNRLMSLQLVEQQLTNAAMFTVDGEVVQPSEVLAGKSVLLGRGAFRPVTNVTRDALDCAASCMERDEHVNSEGRVVVMEMTLHNLTSSEHTVDHADFLARVDTLAALGKTVMVSNYPRFFGVIGHLRKYTRNPIAVVLGVQTLNAIFEDKYYADLDGGLLEGLGRLFRDKVKLYVYPDIDAVAVPAGSEQLYSHLLKAGRIEGLSEFRKEQTEIYPADVLQKIQAGDPSWEKLVPAQAAEIIKREKLFGYRQAAGTPEFSL